MLIKFKIEEAYNLLDKLEIYFKDETNDRLIFDKTIDKMFEKYTKKICSGYDGDFDIVLSFKFCKENQNLDYHKLDSFIFIFEFPDEETAFYYQLKYGIENNV